MATKDKCKKSRQSLQAAKELCKAINASGKPCNIRNKEGSQWCPQHDEERKKLYANYKAHHTALDAFPEHTICRHLVKIKTCPSLQDVRAWNKALISKFRLLTRCIEARAYFTERFFGNDMDFGHKAFWDSLLKQRAEVEMLMIDVEKRAYELILASQNALWVLDRQADVGDDSTKDCSGYEEQALPKPTPLQEAKTAPTEIEDPIDVALREKTAELWERIRTRLARYCTPAASIRYSERLKVIWAVFRRAIYTDASLVFAAQNYTSVESMINNSTLEVTTVEKLWNALKALYVHDVRAAIDDVLRVEKGGVAAQGEYVMVLGGRVYKEQTGDCLPFHAWGHMTAFFLCYTCVRKVCKTMDDVVAYTKFVTLSSATKLSYSSIKHDYDYDNFRVLPLCGFVTGSVDDEGSRYVVTKSNAFSKKSAPYWKETKNNQAICGSLSLNDPKAHKFVEACFKHSDFMVMVRKGTNGQVKRSTPSIWGSRSRQASTRAGLKSAPWEPEQDAFCFQDSVLEEGRPIISPSEARITECIQLFIVDRGEGTMQNFIDKLVDMWLDVYDAEELVDLFWQVVDPLIKKGGLELKKEKKDPNESMFMEIGEQDIMAAYRHLWCSEPKDGKLAEEDL